MRSTHATLILAAVALLGACRDDTPQALGTLEYDRITLPAPAAERIVAIDVREGQRVKAGQRVLLLELDRTRAAASAAARLARACAMRSRRGPAWSSASASRCRCASARAASACAAVSVRSSVSSVVPATTCSPSWTSIDTIFSATGAGSVMRSYSSVPSACGGSLPQPD